jgi:hypothetical protein
MSATDIEETTHPVRFSGRFQSDRRLVVSRAATDIDDDVAVRQCDIGHLPVENHLAAEHFGVEAPRALRVVRHDKVGQHDFS